MSQEPSPAAPAPRYQGFAGAFAFGLLLGGLVLFIGMIAGGTAWLRSGSAAEGRHLIFRLATFSLAACAAGTLCRWLNGAATDDLLVLRRMPGNFGIVGFVLGVILAGYLGMDRPALAVGQPMEIAGPALDGRHFDLAEYRGKVVLVDCWATWCVPCLIELPHLKQLYDKHHAEGLEVVGVSFDEQRERPTQFLKQVPLPWPQIFFDGENERGFANPIAARYDIHTIPTLMIIDRDGRLAAFDVRAEETELAVAEALGRPVVWYTRLAAAAEKLLDWLILGAFRSPARLLLLCTVGGAGLFAALEAAVRRRRRVAPAAPPPL